MVLANVLNILVFNALSIGSGPVVAALVFMKRDVIEVSQKIHKSVLFISKTILYNYEVLCDHWPYTALRSLFDDVATRPVKLLRYHLFAFLISWYFVLRWRFQSVFPLPNPISLFLYLLTYNIRFMAPITSRDPMILGFPTLEADDATTLEADTFNSSGDTFNWLL